MSEILPIVKHSTLDDIHHPERLVSVEHVFGIIKLHPLTIYYRTMTNKLKTLHTLFSCTPFSSTLRPSGCD